MRALPTLRQSRRSWVPRASKATGRAGSPHIRSLRRQHRSAFSQAAAKDAVPLPARAAIAERPVSAPISALAPTTMSSSDKGKRPRPRRGGSRHLFTHHHRALKNMCDPTITGQVRIRHDGRNGTGDNVELPNTICFTYARPEVGMPAGRINPDPALGRINFSAHHVRTQGRSCRASSFVRPSAQK